MSTRLFGSPEVLFTPYGWRAARSLHMGGVNVLLGDGAMRFISDNVDETTWRAISTRGSGELVGEL